MKPIHLLLPLLHLVFCTPNPPLFTSPLVPTNQDSIAVHEEKERPFDPPSPKIHTIGSKVGKKAGLGLIGAVLGVMFLV